MQRAGGKDKISIADDKANLRMLQKFMDNEEYKNQVLGYATETSDILAIPEAEGILMMGMKHARFFNDGRKLLILSKSNNLIPLLEVRKYSKLENIIISFSINPPLICKRTNSPGFILYDLVRLLEAGYKDIRLRIDPIIPIPEWYDHYQYLIEVIPCFVSRITLGTLRATDATYRAMPEWLQGYLVRMDPECHHPWRLSYHTRERVYGHLVPLLRDRGFEIGLCKEHRNFYSLWGIDSKKCNCLA